LLVIPALFGTEILDEEQGTIWGTFRCLYRGPKIGVLEGLRGRPGKVMSGIPILAGWKYDISGALQGALCASGYRAGETLHLFAYDWRLAVMDVGRKLVAEIRALAARTGSDVDLLGLSNGGLLLLAAFAIDPGLPVGRVVTSGSPLGGSIETLACLNAGFRFAPFGRVVSPEEFAACAGSTDSIPRPDVPSFLDAGYDLYDVETWKKLRMSVFRHAQNIDDPVWNRVMTERLNATRATWTAMSRAKAPRRLVCVVGAGLPTQVRIVVNGGKALIPGEGKLRRLPAAALADGDGGVSFVSATAWEAADPQIIRIPVTRHRDVVRTPDAFRAILQALRD
jgi:pimeloyl-ACP methyl ester carboxylesterase